jgi:outer membrane lipoprotein-sorting protein
MIRKFLLFLLIGCLFACAPISRPPVVVPEVSEAELLAILAGNKTSFTSLKGIARISLHESGRKNIRGKHVLLVKKPGQVRTEILGLFGQPIAVAVVDENSAAILVPKEAALYVGKPSPKNVERVLRIPLEIKDLVNFVLYQVPLIDYRTSLLQILPDSGFRLTLKGENGRQEELEFNADKKLVKVLFRDGADKILTVRYGNFSGGEKSFPQRLGLSLPGKGIEAEVEFSSLETNVDLEDELFRLTKPEGFNIRPLL